MFNFLRRRMNGKVVKETQRQVFERAVSELNDIMAGMEEKPHFSVDLNEGKLTFSLPDQMPDEALALPSPNSDAKLEEATPAAA